ncbi:MULTISPECIES: diguanylate cyclase [unclassified Colwellia]|uniref:diguanylate cyclase n=1 Tax=unclassified Colwellia TaxID=196834 RepID=UPI0015F619D0|nr:MULTISPECIES: diguanylate cyclase [unclassified Colwellia]MBA6233280.1 GGDEF domain-containing protein [Colwellia sp. MB02u-7]MBA6236370.1 GGDEF domain-containing protein [Colwellia sp. MB02u-11]MBA6256904.1 GGDEF domain-containing protein [Colwellia sp. MB3u-28]MBA6261090.1 GGDEF domain-containing protein [Colwellia sp. MB3u-41]MBA6298230.1 GGDEF domain-containing protein [Colwellia sp. MB3u-22]
MKFDCCRFLSFAFIMFASLCGQSLADNNRLSVAQVDVPFSQLDMDDEIRRRPLQTYQKLLALENVFSDMPKLHQIWWLLRKAQAENLLYFYKDFNQTVTQAIALIDANTPLKIQSSLYIYQGLIYRRDAQYANSVLILRKAMTIAKKSNLTYLFIIAKQELAYTKSITELYELSLNEMQEAYLEAYALKEYFLIAVINETYGAIYGYLDDYEKSIEYYQKALNTYERLNYPAHVSEAIYGIAATYRYWQKYDQAIQYFELYQKKIAYTPNTEISFFSAYGLGMTLAEKGDCLQAITVINRALTLNGLIDYNAELYKQQVHCFIQLGKLEQAQASLTKAENIFMSLPELVGTKWQLEVIKLGSELAHARNNDSEAFQLSRQYYQQYNKLLVKNSSMRLTSARAAMENERMYIENALTQQREKVSMLENESLNQQKQQNIYLLIFILCGGVIVITVITIQYKNNKKMYAISIKDPLSNLYNRRYIFEYLSNYCKDVFVEKTKLSVILFDIDDFKSVNDKFGHPVGDSVIKKLADLCHDVFRTEDVIGRIGGEEFLCILPRTDEKQCKVIAERLLKKIRQQVFTENLGLQITVSIGIASLSPISPTSEALYLHADAALYQAKHNGKNNVVIYQ